MIPSPPIWAAWTSWRSRSRDRIQRYVRGRVTQRPRRRPSVPCGYLSSPFKLNSPRDQGVVCYAEPCARHLASETASAFVLLTTLGTTQAQSEQNRVDGWNAALPGATPLPAAVEIEPGDARDEEEYTCFGIRSHSHLLSSLLFFPPCTLVAVPSPTGSCIVNLFAVFAKILSHSAHLSFSSTDYTTSFSIERSRITTAPRRRTRTYQEAGASSSRPPSCSRTLEVLAIREGFPARSRTSCIYTRPVQLLAVGPSFSRHLSRPPPPLPPLPTILDLATNAKSRKPTPHCRTIGARARTAA